MLDVEKNVEKNEHIVPVESEEQIDIFIEVFNKAYAGSDPSEFTTMPSAYKNAIRNSFEFSHIKHFIYYENDYPVGCCSLCFYEDYAELINLGVIPSYRKKGIAKELVMFRVSYAKSKGAKKIFAIADKDSRVEKLFISYGGKPKLTATALVKAT